MASDTIEIVESMQNTQDSKRTRRRLKKNTLIQNNPLISSPSLQSARCKPSISSLFLSPFTPNASATTAAAAAPSSSSSPSSSKKKGFASATFRGLGCASPSEVSAPAAIRSSADWQAKRVRKKKQRRKKQPSPATGPAVVVPDVWCSPGMAFAADAASVDCVVSRRPPRGRGDGERIQGERSCIGRRGNILEQISTMDSLSALETQRSGSDLLPADHHRYMRGLRRSPGGFAEIMTIHSSFLLGGPDAYDRYRDWRLDVDNMSYEELLELGDKIGYVSTGLREEEILRCLRKMKLSILGSLPPNLSAGMEWKCSICQEEYEGEDEVGKLECGHGYHLYCIKQWLMQKNACPVCKVAAAEY